MSIRKLSLMVCLLIGLQSFMITGSNKIQFKEKGLSASFKKAKKEHKLVFILVMSRYCAVCHRLDKDLKKGGSYSSFFNTNFECFKLYADNSLKQIKAGNWGVTRVPTMVFMNERHKVVHIYEGYNDMQGFMAQAQKAIDHANEMASVKNNPE